uniref:PHB domain-containing protein n=1 Tax=Heterorhabditis bacteriophora TaxID=37862 RepID=A0A1I7X4I0_HETBA
MSYDVPTQEMLTRDSVTVSVDAAVYYRTRRVLREVTFIAQRAIRVLPSSDPIASLSAVNDAHHSTRQLAQTTLRNVLGTRTLEEIMSDREGIAAQAKQILDTGGVHLV